MSKTIDITPTWSAWLNMVMAIALRGKDPAKVLEPLDEEFKKMARAADGYNAIPSDALDTLDAAIKLLEHLTKDCVSSIPVEEPITALKALHSTLISVVKEVQE